MSDRTEADRNRRLMDRHARLAVLIDRLESQWAVCFLNEREEYEAVDPRWSKELIEELNSLHNLYAEAVANEGDVRHCLIEASVPETAAEETTNVQ